MEKLDPVEINKKSYSTDYAVKEVYNRVGLNDREEYLINKYFHAGAKVLDIGCGTGRTTAPLKGRGFEVIGIDLSEEMIKFARPKHAGIDFRVMDACDLKFEDESFDNVLFSNNGIDCIYPAKKRDKCYAEIHRVLKKDGLFVFSFHNALCLPVNRVLLSVAAENLLTFRMFTNYRVETPDYGKQYVYYGIPFIEGIKIRKIGFQVLEVRGRKHKNGFLMMFLELSSYYVARKI